MFEELVIGVVPPVLPMPAARPVPAVPAVPLPVAVSPASAPPAGPLTEVRAWLAALEQKVVPGTDGEQGLIDLLRVLEELKGAAAAAQAAAAVAFDTQHRSRQREAGVPRDQLGRGVGAQIALARRESPAKGSRLLGFAAALLREMPCTHAALAQGRISEWRATLLVRETACLSVEDRRRVDETLASDVDELELLGDRQIISRARQLAYRLDPQSVVQRAAKAESGRYVSCRPAPDTMAYLTGLLPVAQGVEVYAVLSRAADSLRSRGDSRSRGQIMADTLVERITGRAEARGTRIEVQLVMTDRALFQGDAEPAELAGYGVVPAGWARKLVLAEAGSGTAPGSRGSAEAWLRRIYTAPGSGELIAMDSRARRFPAGMRRFISVRDRTCRTPWCSAPIRHFDHVTRYKDGGATSTANGQGLCENCNQVKEAPWWEASVVPARPSTVSTRTPTGHTYTSRPLPLPSRDPEPRAATGDSHAWRAASTSSRSSVWSAVRYASARTSPMVTR